MTAVLELKNLCKFINKKKIINNLSFTVNEGEIFGFLGPNGAGKTTTIKMITGLISISSGDIFIDGVNIKNNFEKAMENIGAIIENPDMYTYMSGLDNLKCYARIHGNISNERIEEIIKLVKLENRIKDKVKKYSLGMKQRLGLAQALLHEPKLLILDEPTNGLDPSGIKELREVLNNLTKNGVSVLVSSHLLSEMELMCHRFCIIDNGTLIDIKSMKDINNENNKGTKVYMLDIDDINKGKNIIKDNFKDIEINLYNDKLKLITSRDIISKINKTLITNDINVYEISVLSKTLEEEFIALTNTK